MIDTKYFITKRDENGGTFEGIDRRFEFVKESQTYWVHNILTGKGYRVFSYEHMQAKLQGDEISNDEVVQICAYK